MAPSTETLSEGTPRTVQCTQSIDWPAQSAQIAQGQERYRTESRALDPAFPYTLETAQSGRLSLK